MAKIMRFQVRHLCVLCAFSVFLAAAVPVELDARQESAFADTRLYEAVLDRLFRVDSSTDVPTAQLRFTYCENGEMQIAIYSETNGGFRVQLWRVPKNTPTVWEQLERMWSSNRGLTVDEAIGVITLARESRSISRSAPLSGVIRARPRTVGLEGRDEIILEAGRYELFIRSLGKSLSLSVQGPQDWRRSPDRIVRWMGQVRLEIDKL